MIRKNIVFAIFLFTLIILLPLVVISTQQQQDVRQQAKNDSKNSSEQKEQQEKKDEGDTEIVKPLEQENTKNDNENDSPAANPLEQGQGNKYGILGRLSATPYNTNNTKIAAGPIITASPIPIPQTSSQSAQPSQPQYNIATSGNTLSPTIIACTTSMKVKTVIIDCQNCMQK